MGCHAGYAFIGIVRRSTCLLIEMKLVCFMCFVLWVLIIQTKRKGELKRFYDLDLCVRFKKRLKCFVFVIMAMKYVSIS